MSEKLIVPDIGNFDKVEVIELLVKVGDKININDPVVTIENDKSSVEVPTIISGIVESVNVKVGDKVSKGDLLLNISSSKEVTLEKIIPKDTENIIKEAEAVLKTTKEKNIQEEPIKKEQQTNIQISNENDIDPLETQDWIESLSAVVEKDGNQRAHFLIKELINKAYKEGVNIPYTQNTPYISTIPAEAQVKSSGAQNME